MLFRLVLHQRLWDMPTDCWVCDAPSDIIEHCFTVPWLEPHGFNHLWEFKSTISMMSLADILLNLWEHFDENQVAFSVSPLWHIWKARFARTHGNKDSRNVCTICAACTTIQCQYHSLAMIYTSISCYS